MGLSGQHSFSSRCVCLSEADAGTPTLIVLVVATSQTRLQVSTLNETPITTSTADLNTL